MGRLRSILDTLLAARSDANTEFSDLLYLLQHLGFERRVKGSHHIFWKSGVEEILNLQPLGNKAKPYQVKQVRNLLIKYGLHRQDE
jgi:hypothetical protein